MITAVKRFDQQSTSLIKGLPWQMARLMDWLGFAGEPAVVLTAGLAGLISALVRGQSNERTAYILGFIAFSACTLLKLALRRRRPHGRVVRNFGINSYSFPSGHAFGSVIFYGLFAILGAKQLSSPWDLVLLAILVMIIFLIGISRVYKGAHFPSDVLAGWMLGCISLAVINWLAF